MKSTRIVGAAISLSLSALLLSGIQAAHDFAYYVCFCLNVLGWLCFWSVSKPETAQHVVGRLWFSLPIQAIAIYALASTGHPKLAASSFLLSFVIMCMSFSVLRNKEAKE